MSRPICSWRATVSTRSPTWTWRENVLVRVIVTDGDRIQRYEVFDTCDTDRALARFEELSADLPSRRPGDAALRELG